MNNEPTLDDKLTSDAMLMLTGNRTATCQFPGYLDAPFPHCEEIVCTEPVNATGATLTGVKAVYKYQDRLQYQCLPGYRQISGDPLRVCGFNSEWTGKFSWLCAQVVL